MDVFEIGPERQVYTKRNIDLKIGKNNYNSKGDNKKLTKFSKKANELIKKYNLDKNIFKDSQLIVERDIIKYLDSNNLANINDSSEISEYFSAKKKRRYWIYLNKRRRYYRRA